MKADTSSILALDFDGVVCDGLKEYFETAWRTYCQIWCPEISTPSVEIADSFYKLRPVIETGWEMPILVKALIAGVSEQEILHRWGEISQSCLQKDRLIAADIALKLDQIRDRWISSDLESWLNLHRFYPGVVEKIKSLGDRNLQLIIITTKEGRFVRQLLQKQGVEIPPECIIGKESKRPKHQVLKELMTKTQVIWFIEDRAEDGASAIANRQITELDVVVGITAGGTTPYVHGALHSARQRGATTIFMACVPVEQVSTEADIDIRLLTGAEILAGSTRLKAGTATKLALNILSTGVMVKLGKVYGNRMIDVAVTNKKLRDRAIRMLQDLTNLNREAASLLLEQSGKSVKLALAMHWTGLDKEASDRLLSAHQGNLRAAVDSQSP